MEYLTNLWNNQPNILIGGGLASLVSSGIYIKLLINENLLARLELNF